MNKTEPLRLNIEQALNLVVEMRGAFTRLVLVTPAIQEIQEGRQMILDGLDRVTAELLRLDAERRLTKDT